MVVDAIGLPLSSTMGPPSPSQYIMVRRRRRLLSVGFIAIIRALFLVACDAKEDGPCHTYCGNIQNISYPFYLKGDPPNCGDRTFNYELACEDNRTILYLNSSRYYVKAITYSPRTIRIGDPGVHKDNCSSIPRYSLANFNFSIFQGAVIGDGTAYPYYLTRQTNYIFLMDCENPINSHQYLDTTPCINGSTSSSLRKQSYATWGKVVSDVRESCRIGVMVPSRLKEVGNYSFSDIHNELAWGFELSWFQIDCTDCQGRQYDCFLFDDNNIQCYNHTYPFPSPHCSASSSFICGTSRLFGIIVQEINYHKFFILSVALILVARNSCGTLCCFALLIYKLRRRHLSQYDAIEEFLQGNNNLMPIRYSYLEIKKMTKYFKDKLGQGGYGSVFRGKLRSGRLVAVKMLGNSKGNGQDFINEVLTIGRIHHVNIVQLTGFCAEGSKRALVYDFMPNGSLEKYIFCPEVQVISLSWEKMYEISLGVARGIEYLHQGCDMQILHFDIKPHNILLDQNFTPKVSDFGLAKLYPTDESIVSLTTARGTTGNIAPELFYKSIGGISYKADVYSFGMLLMEMAGRRKNLNAFAKHSSQIYFPSWVYDQFNQGEDIEMEDATEDEKKLAKKMIIVALWCIQLKPMDRPSMSKVIEMLEGSVELLQMPPKPFLCPQEMPIEDHATNANHTEISSMSCNSIEMTTLDVNVD